MAKNKKKSLYAKNTGERDLGIISWGFLVGGALGGVAGAVVGGTAGLGTAVGLQIKEDRKKRR